jgi:hypothetical protein
MQFPVPTVTPSVDRIVSVHLSDKESTAPCKVFELSTRSPPRSNNKTFKPPSAIVCAKGHPAAPALSFIGKKFGRAGHNV